MIENKIMNYKRIIWSLIKIGVLTTMTSLIWIGFSAIDQTLAPFNDIETSSDNTFSASRYFPPDKTDNSKN